MPIKTWNELGFSDFMESNNSPILTNRDIQLYSNIPSDILDDDTKKGVTEVKETLEKIQSSLSSSGERKLSPIEIKQLLENFDPSQIKGGQLSKNVKFSGRVDLKNVTTSGKTIVVDVGGNIQDAIDEISSRGGGIVFLKSGTHTPTTDLTVASNISIQGEGVGLTIIDFGGGARTLNFIGTISTGSGTVSFTNGTTTVTGNLTTFTNATVGDYIIETGSSNMTFLSEVLSIESDTSLTLKNVWPGDDFTNTTYEIINFNKNCSLKNLTIQNSTDTTGGLDITRAYNFYSENVLVRDCTNDGINSELVFNGFFTNTESSYNSGNGWDIDTPSRCTFINCSAYRNGSYGFDYLGSVQADVFITCVADGNTTGGFLISTLGGRFISCRAYKNGIYGFYITGSNTSFLGCLAKENSRGFALGSLVENSICALNESNNNSLYDWDVASSYPSNIFIGNVGGGTINTSFNTATLKGIMSLNRDANIGDNTQVVRMKNTSGATINTGAVVVLKAVAAGDEITTTTTASDPLVLGTMRVSTTNNSYGPVQTLGKLYDLKVDGTTNIAIGDFLTTFTTAGIAKKAASGDLAFAIALEAYTADDSSGAISALLITPRKI